MSKNYNNKINDISYKFCMFKYKGHETWRFNNSPKTPVDIKPEDITDKRFININRLTGEVFITND